MAAATYDRQEADDRKEQSEVELVDGKDQGHNNEQPLLEVGSYLETFKLHDIDENGFITAKEIRRTLRKKFTEEELVSIFRGFDHDGNGKISESELSKLAKGMVRLADADGDLRLNFAEYGMYQGVEP